MEESAIVFLFILAGFFLYAFVYLCSLMNRDIWWGVFELTFVSPAGYLNPCAISLSAGVSFQSGLL